MYASQEGHEHVVEALLKGGATVDIQDEVIPVITPLYPHTLFGVRTANCLVPSTDCNIFQRQYTSHHGNNDQNKQVSIHCYSTVILKQ